MNIETLRQTQMRSKYQGTYSTREKVESERITSIIKLVAIGLVVLVERPPGATAFKTPQKLLEELKEKYSLEKR